jgi:hypothetical protein
MKSARRKILFPIGIIWFIALMIAGFLAYFVTSSGPHGMVDGLGRPLTEAPFLMRFFFGQERLWAGFGWFFGEMVIFWGSLGFAPGLSNWLEDGT